MDKTVWTLENTEFPELCPMEGRSPGIHVSDIISVLKGYERQTEIPNEQLGRMELGKALERAIIAQMIDHHHDLTAGWELEKDGIYGTFDAMQADVSGRDRIVEIKLTSMRPSELPEGYPHNCIDDVFAWDSKFSHWLMQLKAYCYMHETNLGRLIAVHVNRDLTASWRDRSVYFSTPELQMNWLTLTSVRDLMEKGGCDAA